jgi:uncharacterized integral membrane protein
MQFLKTLFWVVLAVVAVLLAKANWFAVELRLWGGLVADAKLPILLLLAFLLGFLPTMLFYRARIWSLKRRMEPLERNAVAIPAAPAAAPAAPVAPPTPDGEERVATDTKIWPTA